MTIYNASGLITDILEVVLFSMAILPFFLKIISSEQAGTFSD